MANIPYQKGKIKVVWIEDDPKKIYSKMFDSEKEATIFAEGKKDYLIFALENQKEMEEFSWAILPYGRYKLYLKIVKYSTRLLEVLTQVARI